MQAPASLPGTAETSMGLGTWPRLSEAPCGSQPQRMAGALDLDFMAPRPSIHPPAPTSLCYYPKGRCQGAVAAGAKWALHLKAGIQVSKPDRCEFTGISI